MSVVDDPKSPSRLVRRVMLVALPCLFLACGCGKRDPFERQPIRGTVTWQGKPIQYGSLAFEPAGGQRAGAMASIRDGGFSIPRSAGPSPGDYDVWVHAFDHPGEVPPGTLPGQEGPPPKEILPAKYRNAAAARVKVERVTDEKPNEITVTLD